MSKQYIVQITFHFNGREVFVSPISESWEQWGCPTHLLLNPEFLDRLWELMNDYEMLG